MRVDEHGKFYHDDCATDVESLPNNRISFTDVEDEDIPADTQTCPICENLIEEEDVEEEEETIPAPED